MISSWIPTRIWIAEVMLQQTQLAVALPTTGMHWMASVSHCGGSGCWHRCEQVRLLWQAIASATLLAARAAASRRLPT